MNFSKKNFFMFYPFFIFLFLLIFLIIIFIYFTQISNNFWKFENKNGIEDEKQFIKSGCNEDLTTYKFSTSGTNIVCVFSKMFSLPDWFSIQPLIRYIKKIISCFYNN